MSNHIKFLSWRGSHSLPNCQVMSESMIMLWGLSHVLPAEQDVPTPLPFSWICPKEQHRNTEEALRGAVKCLMLILKLLLVLCSAKDLSHLLAARCLLFSLLLSLPQGTWGACLPRSPARTDSWEWAPPGEGKGYKQVGFGFSGANLPVLCSSDRWGSSPLKMLFSSWKLVGRVFQQCWSWQDRWYLLFIELGSEVEKSLVPGCDCTTPGAVLVLHIWLFCLFCCWCAQLGALPWAPLCYSSSFMMLRISGQEGAALVQGLRRLVRPQRVWLCPCGNRGLKYQVMCYTVDLH